MYKKIDRSSIKRKAIVDLKMFLNFYGVFKYSLSVALVFNS